MISTRDKLLFLASRALQRCSPLITLLFAAHVQRICPHLPNTGRRRRLTTSIFYPLTHCTQVPRMFVALPHATLNSSAPAPREEPSHVIALRGRKPVASKCDHECFCSRNANHGCSQKVLLELKMLAALMHASPFLETHTQDNCTQDFEERWQGASTKRDSFEYERCSSNITIMTIQHPQRYNAKLPFPLLCLQLAVTCSRVCRSTVCTTGGQLNATLLRIRSCSICQMKVSLSSHSAHH